MAEATDLRQPKGRYRKVEVKVWGDEKFRRLSPIPPCGQGLWLFLITGPHTGPIPGLFRAGRAAMAEELGWEVEAFDKAFSEALRQGMVEADFKSRVVWVPKAISHNRPESPNVVRSWRSEFDQIPECDLKRDAIEHLRAFVYGLGEGFAKAFDESFGKALPKPLAKAMPNQEQEQEQEQEEDEATDVALSTAGDEPAAADGDLLGDKTQGGKRQMPACPHEEIVAGFMRILPECPVVRVWSAKRRKHLQTRWKADPERQTLEWWEGLFEFIRGSDWLMGKVSSFKVSLPWIVESEENLAKVLEGNYHGDRR